MNASLTKYFISTQAPMFSFSVNIFCTHATRGRFTFSSLIVVVTYSFILWWRLLRSLVLFLFAFLKRKNSTQLSYKCEASVLGLVYCSLEGKKWQTVISFWKWCMRAVFLSQYVFQSSPVCWTNRFPERTFVSSHTRSSVCLKTQQPQTNWDSVLAFRFVLFFLQ